MAVSFVNTAKTDVTSATGSIALTVPASVASGDYMFAWLVTSAGAFSYTPPAGWTLLFSQLNATTGLSIKLFGKQAGASEPGTVYTWTHTGTFTKSAVMMIYRGLDTSYATLAGSNTAIAPSVNTIHPDGMLITIGGGQSGTAPGAPSPAMNNRNTGTSSGAGVQWRIGDRALPSTGASGTETYTGSVDATISLGINPLNVAPNTPSGLSPDGGATFDRTITQRFSVPFSDPDPGDSQSQVDIQWWLLDAFGSRVGSATVVSDTTPNPYHDFASGYFAAGDYEWQARSYDALGVASPWSSSAFFTAATSPTSPTITAPTSGATLSATPTPVTWSFPTQQAYQVRTVADSAGSPDTGTVYFDTGQITDATTRTVDVPFPVNNRYEHIQVRVQSAGLWSAWSSIRVEVVYDPPPAPDVTVETFDADAAIGLTYSTAAPGAGEVAATYVEVYRSDDGGTTSLRIATALPISGSFIDPTPASGVDYSYAVVAVASNGVQTSSGWIGASTEGTGGVYGSGY